MIRKVREVQPQANIVPIDYDPSATKVNQENRIKLMLAVAQDQRQTEKAGRFRRPGGLLTACPYRRFAFPRHRSPCFG